MSEENEGQEDEQIPQDAPEANDPQADTTVDAGDNSSAEDTGERADSARDGSDTSTDAVAPEPVPMAGLTPGGIVHYVEDTPTLPASKHKPAIVTDVVDGVTGLIDLVYFNPTTQRDEEPCRGYFAVPFDDADKAPGTWHWIEKA